MSLIGIPYFAGTFAGLLIATVHITASASAKQAEQTERTMDLIEQRVTENFNEFEKEQDPTLVHEALDTIEAAERDMPVGDATAFKRAVSRRLRFFVALDRNIDPMWDQKDVPVMGVPPPLSHGIVYGSGEVDPATIPDPEARAQYVQALKVNKDDNHRYFVQLQLRRIDERTMRFVELLLADRYTNSKGGRQEFEELLAASPVNELRKKRLRALVPSS